MKIHFNCRQTPSPPPSLPTPSLPCKNDTPPHPSLNKANPPGSKSKHARATQQEPRFQCWFLWSYWFMSWVHVNYLKLWVYHVFPDPDKPWWPTRLFDTQWHWLQGWKKCAFEMGRGTGSKMWVLSKHCCHYNARLSFWNWVKVAGALINSKYVYIT